MIILSLIQLLMVKTGRTIENEINAVGGDEDKIEEVLFEQIKETLDLDFTRTYLMFLQTVHMAISKIFQKGLCSF